MSKYSSVHHWPVDICTYFLHTPICHFVESSSKQFKRTDVEKVCHSKTFDEVERNPNFVA